MNEKLIEIINNWNPADIYPLLEDEYYPEIIRIEEFIVRTKELTINTLATFINFTFINAFDENIFAKSFKDCESVAEKILLMIK